MNRIYIIAVMILIPIILLASDKAIIDMANDLKLKTAYDNNTYKDNITDVIEKMRDNITVDAVIPPVNIFTEETTAIMKHYDLPTDTKFIKDNDTCINPDALGNYKVFVFISESVPKVTLKNYMQDAMKFEDVLLVMRGVIGNATYIKPTMDFMLDLSCGKSMQELTTQEECDVSRVDINPQLFTLFDVEKAPAVVYSKLSYYDLMLRANLGQSVNDDEYFIIRGDMALEYVLTSFSKVGADVSKYLKVLQGSLGG